MPTASTPTAAAAAVVPATTPVDKTRRVLRSFPSLEYDDQEKLITAFHKAANNDDTTQNNALLDDILDQLENKLEHENFSHDKDKLSPAGRQYINDQQLIFEKDDSDRVPPPPTKSTRLIEELYTNDKYQWQYIYDQDNDLQEPLRGKGGRDNKSIRVIRGVYNPTYNYGDGSGFYSINLPNGDGSFLVIIGISKGKTTSTNKGQGINGRIKDTHAKHAGRGYVTVIKGIPTDVLDVFELMIKKMAFPLRPKDHVGTELFEIHTEKYAFGFTGMIVSFAFSHVVQGMNLVIPADINRPETDFISIKKPLQGEEGITYVEEHPKLYQARRSNHNHKEYEKLDEQAGEMYCFTLHDCVLMC